MRYEDINKGLQNVAFEFFYRFSRFEFALKQNHYLKTCKKIGKNAQPDWDKFIERWCGEYSASDEAKKLICARPKRQVVTVDGNLEWANVRLNNCHNDLSKVVRLLQTVRNNLFHGGKHNVGGWDNDKRTNELLKLGITVLNELAEFADITADYTGYY